MSNFNSAYNRVVWVDIPVSDLNRAAAFYRAVLNCEVDVQESDDSPCGILSHSGGNAGRLIPAETEIASNGGILIYLNVNGRIRNAVTLVEENGGKIVQRIHTMEPFGFRAVVLDSEGNRIALHSIVDA